MTDMGRVAWGLSSGKYLMPAGNKDIHSVVFVSPLSSAFSSVNVSA